MNNRMKKLIAVVLLVVAGVVFIVFGCVTLKEMREFLPVSAVVSAVQTEWVPDGDGGDTQEITIYVTYTVDGKEYKEALQNTKTNLKEGEAVTVLYNPQDPTQVSGASKSIVTIQMAFGAVMILAGIGTFASILIKGR